MGSTANDSKAIVELTEDIHNDLKSTVIDKSQLVSNAGEILKLPVPSQDPNDPLNFTFWEKTGIICSCCWFCMTVFFIPGPLLASSWNEGK